MYNGKNISSPNSICVVNNIHGLFLYFLLCPDEFDNTLFVFSEDIPYEVSSRIKNKIVFPSFNGHSRKVALLLKVFYYWYFKIRKFKSITKGIVKYYGHDHLYFSGMFVNNNFILLEDGTANYLTPSEKKESKLKKILKKMLIGDIGGKYGFNNCVKKVILTGLMPVPKQLKIKSSIICMKSHWENLSSEQINKLLYLFNEHSFPKFKKVVIFTQPFSEDNLISEHDKREIYSFIIDYYLQIFNLEDICIKPHPREITNYATLYGCDLVNTKLPAQILLFNSPPEVAATVYSSAVYQQMSCRVDIFGTQPFPVLAKKVGIIPGNIEY
ncbi:polysialyltransferase family glycosyltransferase [Pantoea sp. FN0305]|uniref:polysialyltransferase family glycosyltransferase n=1 Tax=Pantoea sp. FN0305 TaxID=3418559 RepID=UPI003CF750B8